MEEIDKNYLLIFLGIGLVILEIILGALSGFDLFLVGIILILAGGIGIFTQNFILALLTIFLASFLYIFGGRRFIKSKLAIETKATNIDKLIGRKGLVIKKISPQKPGQVEIEGEIWRAEAEKEIEKGKEVIVKGVSGVTLRVDFL